MKRRLAKVAKGLPKQGDNINKFVIPAFILLKDCALITQENIEFLNSKSECDYRFGIKMNPLGGVLRKKGLTMWDKTNLRYYCPNDKLILRSDIETAGRKKGNFGGGSKLAVICKGITYYISNDWFADDTARPTKRKFYNWLQEKAWENCKLLWTYVEMAKKLEVEKNVENQKNIVENPASDFKFKVNDSDDGIIITKYVGSATKVVIPAMIENLPVTEIGKSAFSFCSSLTKIVIPDSVTEIGSCAFDGCSSLTEIVIPDSVKTIGDNICKSCDLQCVYINKNWSDEFIERIFGENPTFEILRTPQDVKNYLKTKMENLNVSLWFTLKNWTPIKKVFMVFAQDELSTKIIYDALHSIHELEELILDEK